MRSEPRLEIYTPPRQHRCLIGLGIFIIAMSGVLALMASSSSSLKLWGYAGLAAVVGLVTMVPNAWSLFRPKPFLIVDEAGVRWNQLCLHRSTIAFEQISHLVVFTVHDWPYLGIAAHVYDPVHPHRPGPFKWLSRLNRMTCGERVAFAISGVLLGERFDDVVQLLSETVGCEVIRRV